MSLLHQDIRHEDRSPSPLAVRFTGCDYYDIKGRIRQNIPHNNEVTRPCVKPVDKELSLATFGDQATLPEDNMKSYDPHVTSVLPVSPETIPTPKETKQKGLYPHLDLPRP